MKWDAYALTLNLSFHENCLEIKIVGLQLRIMVGKFLYSTTYRTFSKFKATSSVHELHFSLWTSLLIIHKVGNVGIVQLLMEIYW